MGTLYRSALAPVTVNKNELGQDLNPNWQNIPPELRALKQWAVSTLTVDPSTQKPDKSPRNPHTRERVSVVDPSGWASFDECANSGAPAIGFILTEGDPFVIIDLDRKPDTSAEELAAHERILNQFPTYTERSISGNGFHIILKGELGGGVRQGAVEVYGQERYMVCTGNVHRGGPVQVADPKALADLVAVLGGVQVGVALSEVEDEPLRREDDEIIQSLGDALYQPHPPGSDKSQEDYKLMSRIVWHTRNQDQAMKLFLNSGYYRPEKGKNYVPYSFAKAIRQFREAHPYATPIFIEHGRRLIEGSRVIQRKMGRRMRTKGFNLVLAGTMPFEEQRFLIEELFEVGELVVMFGPPGAGKSFIAIDMAACVATGKAFHGLKVEAGTVVYIAGEGHAGLARRRRAWELAHGVELGTSPLYFSTVSASLLDPDSIEKVITKIEELQDPPGKAGSKKRREEAASHGAEKRNKP